MRFIIGVVAVTLLCSCAGLHPAPRKKRVIRQPSTSAKVSANTSRLRSQQAEINTLRAGIRKLEGEILEQALLRAKEQDAVSTTEGIAESIENDIEKQRDIIQAPSPTPAPSP